MDCPVCQGDNRDGARFCRHCGSLLAVETALEINQGEAKAEAMAEPEPALTVEEPELHDKETTIVHEPTHVSVRVGDDLLPEPDVEPPADEVAPVSDEFAEAIQTGPEVGAASTASTRDDDSEPQVAESPDPGPATGQEDLESPAQVADEGVPLPVDETPEVELGGSQGHDWSPLAPGAVIGGRYLVVDVLETDRGLAFYGTRDLRRCWQCGFQNNDPDDRFCAQCGVTLDRRRNVHLLEVPLDQEAGADVSVLFRLDEDGRRFLILDDADVKAEDESEGEALGLWLKVGQATDTGRVRELNEDSLLSMTLAPSFGSSAAPLLGLYAVADGMGGHQGGEVASRLALQVLARRVAESIVLPELEGSAAPGDELARCLADAVSQANDGVFLARQKRDTDMGTTLTAALVRGDQLILAHVGDSRAYRWCEQGLEQLTADHSLVARMVAAGQIEADEIYTHPHRSVIYRSIGDRPLVDVDTHVLDLSPGDRLVLCSDGLWEMIRTEGIEDVMMQEADPQTACDTLVRHANLAGGEDNISVIVVLVEPA